MIFDLISISLDTKEVSTETMLPLVAICEATASSWVSLLSTILLINLLFKLITKSIEVPEKKFAIILPIIYFTTQSISFGVRVVGSILFYDLDDKDEQYSNPIAGALDIISISCVAIFTVSWYLWMLLQLKSSFKGTVFKIPKTIMIFHFLFFGLILLSMLVIVFNSFILQSQPLFAMSISIHLLFYYIGYYHMVWLFNRRLYKLMNIQLVDTQTQPDISHIIELITKAVTLYTIHSLVTVAIFVIIAMNAVFHTDIMVVVYWISVAFYNCFMALCMFLMLQFNEKYYGYLCKSCDAGFAKLCEHFSTRYRKKPNLENVLSTSSDANTPQIL